jgi:hypothetical protein
MQNFSKTNEEIALALTRDENPGGSIEVYVNVSKTGTLTVLVD